MSTRKTGDSYRVSPGPEVKPDRTDLTFPTPWAARIFAMTLALHEQGHFTWPEWSDRLADKIASGGQGDSDPESYWLCWHAALCDMVERGGLASPSELADMTETWRQTAEKTPHGEPLELARQIKVLSKNAGS